MKRTLFFILILCFCLTGCVKTQTASEIRADAIAYAEENAKMLIDCAKAALEIAEQYDLIDEHLSVCRISAEKSGALLVHPHFSKEDFSLENEILSRVFRENKIFEIQVRKDAVEFGIETNRLLPTDTYYKIIYIPFK